MKRPGSLTLMAIWAFISALLYLIGGAAIAAFAFPEALSSGIGSSSTGSNIGLIFALLFLLGFFGLSLASGIGILKAKSWARKVTMVVAVLSLFWFPVGTVIGVFVLIYLVKPEVRAYFKGSQ